MFLIMKKILSFIIIFFLISIFIISPCVYADKTAYVWSNQSNKLESKQTSTSPIGDTSDTITDNSLGLTSGSACLIEQSTGKVIYDYNMHEQLRPASVTKVMS